MDGLAKVTPNGVVRDAVVGFRVSRLVAMWFTLAAGSAAYRATSPGANGKSMFLLSVGCIVVACGIELHARSKLLAELIADGLRRGMAHPLAALYAQRCLRQLRSDNNTWDDLPAYRHAKDALMSYPDITITQLDLERLGAVLDTCGVLNEDAADRLHAELVRAKVVPSQSVPDDLVTMNSRVCFRDESAGVKREITLVYPVAANAAEHRVSILSPLGSALFGLRVGQAIEWPLPNGRRKLYRVLAVPYQPEASGHFHL